jgi:hypothetical protein
MNNIKIEKIDYSNYGNCVRLSNGIIEAIITLDCGPRIIKFAFIGKDNFMFEDINRDVKENSEVIEAVFGKGSQWYIYGGHRMWLSPEDLPLTYYPDNEQVNCNEIKNGVELIAPIQKVNEVQYRFVITMHAEKPKLEIKHYVTNTGINTKNNAIWCLTVLGKGGLEVIPQPLYDTGLLANRVISLWPYADMSDERVYWGKKYITLKQDKNISSAFKFGINNIRNFAAYFNHNSMFIKKYHSNPDGKYPDYGTSFETYTNNHFLEMETLGELTDITPGSTMYHSEEWELVDNVMRPAEQDEVTIDALVKVYIEK